MREVINLTARNVSSGTFVIKPTDHNVMEISMQHTVFGWSNKGDTSAGSCDCGSWRDHWMKYSNLAWPGICSVQGCSSAPTLGGHVINEQVTGEKIVPMCDTCNGLSGSFNLKGGVRLISANTAETCEKG